jgi:hypothetical protein
LWEDINAIKMHLIKRDFVKGHKTWSHHGEAESTFNNADIGTRYDELGDEDADENDHVMMDDAFGCEDQNHDQTDAPQVDEECDVDMEEMLHHIVANMAPYAISPSLILVIHDNMINGTTHIV